MYCCAIARQLGDRVDEPRWTFLTNHGHVLVCIGANPGLRVRDIAARVGITERATLAILADLEAAAYVTRRRVGRRTHYEVHEDRPLRHRLEDHHSVGELLTALRGATP